MKYTKKQIQESIDHWTQVLESMYDGKSILHDFNTAVMSLDPAIKSNADALLDVIRDLLAKLKPTVNLENEDIPAENELGFAIVDFILALVSANK